MNLSTLAVTLSAAALTVLSASQIIDYAVAEEDQSGQPQYNADGELFLPENFREWVFLGSPLTPNELNGGEAGFPEYHNVYIHPNALAAYKETGQFAEGTILFKELQLIKDSIHPDGSSEQASGRGFFPGAFNGADVVVKDSERFAETNGWGFFNFGHHAPPYAETAAALPGEACADCHAASAEKDMIFTQFYTLLQ